MRHRLAKAIDVNVIVARPLHLGEAHACGLLPKNWSRWYESL
jgi:hypothetical protein